MKFGIVTDSSCDLPESYTAQEEVTVVSFYVSFDGENYLKEGKEAGITEFYQKMADNPDCYPKTSMPSVQDSFCPYCHKQQCGVKNVLFVHCFSLSIICCLN